MSRVRGGVWLWLGLGAIALLSPVLSAEPPVRGPGPVPAPAAAPEDPPAPGPPPAAPAPAPDAAQGAEAPPAGPPRTFEDLDRILGARPHIFLWILALRFLPVIAGVGFLVLYLVRRAEVARGVLPPPAWRPPTVPFDLAQAGLICLGVVGLAAFLGHLARLQPGDITTTLLVTAGGSLPFAAVVIARRWQVRRTAPLSAPRALGVGLAVLCMASTVTVPVTIVVRFLSEVLGGGSPALQELVTEALADRPTAWQIAAFGVLAAPIAEEALFRGLLYPALRHALGGSGRAAWGSALITSALFSAVHANWLVALPLFALALFLARLMERTDSLLACVVAHAAHNALAMASLLLVTGGA